MFISCELWYSPLHPAVLKMLLSLPRMPSFNHFFADRDLTWNQPYYHPDLTSYSSSPSHLWILLSGNCVAHRNGNYYEQPVVRVSAWVNYSYRKWSRVAQPVLFRESMWHFLQDGKDEKTGQRGCHRMSIIKLERIVKLAARIVWKGIKLICDELNKGAALWWATSASSSSRGRRMFGKGAYIGLVGCHAKSPLKSDINAIFPYHCLPAISSSRVAILDSHSFQYIP